MYNEELKLRYLGDAETRNENIMATGKVMFNRVGPAEVALRKDCCNFSFDDIIEMYSGLMSHSLDSLLNLNSQLKLYTAYCLERGYVTDGINHYAEVSKKDVLKCVNVGQRNGQIISRDELLSLFNYTSFGVSDDCDRFVLLALFEGIGGPGLKEFMHLSMKDFKGNEVHLNSGRVLTVSDKLLSLAKSSSEQYSRDPYMRSVNSRTEKVLLDLTDPSILKQRRNVRKELTVQTNIRRIQTMLSALKERTGAIALTRTSLTESGRIDMIGKLMVESKNTDWRDVYKKNVELIEQRYVSSRINKLSSYDAQYGVSDYLGKMMFSSK